ncbi:helix-turn-helix domain-containing protein [Croceitalea rosinachiae]|uniref:Helix-turn-helix domain-containing protein n=1 Tax=Croceitalea rosinachiae TaxID=3075596 RepID=A0ABU3A6B0_9FLAO|nr:helix-turn-helix domain-containing protein [Croceitalea sp. F388]MDT0605504.1 helix-turn-helix domain-containing protein [Croceitalea sp. F388]
MMHVDLQFSLRELVQAIIGFQSLLFFVVMVIGASRNRWSDLFLGGFFLLLGAQMIVLISEGIMECSSCFDGFLCVFGFGYGPVIYLFVQSLIYRDYRPQKKQLLHIAPVLLLSLGGFLGLNLCPRIGSLLYVSILIYLVLTIKSVVRYHKMVHATQSTDSSVNLKWIQWMMIFFVITLLFDLFQHFYNSIDLIGDITPVEISLLILVNGMFYLGIRQPLLFKGIGPSDVQFAEEHLNVNHSSSEDIPVKLEEVNQFLLDSKVYQKSDLSLSALAREQDISPRQLSQLINRYAGKSFMDYINTFRIDYAKQRLQNPLDPGETIQEVMYGSGFNSKSSFNTIFKAKTGQTPSQYKKTVSKK